MQCQQSLSQSGLGGDLHPPQKNPSRVDLQKSAGSGHTISKLGGKYSCCSGSHKCPCIQSVEWKREMVASLPCLYCPAGQFASQEPLFPSYPLLYGHFSTFGCREFVPPNFRLFSELFILIWVFSWFPWDEVNLGSSYFTIFPRSLREVHFYFQSELL